MKRHLTKTKIEALKPKAKPYKVFNGGGLFLLVKPNGSMAWHFTYRLKDSPKQNTISLGSYPEVSLVQAIKLHEDARSLVANGKDPSTKKKEEKAKAEIELKNSFGAIAKEWLAIKSKTWKESTRIQREAILNRDILPALKKKPIGSIKVSDTKPLILKIAERKEITVNGRKRANPNGAPTVANIANQIIHEVYRFASHMEYVTPGYDPSVDLSLLGIKHTSKNNKFMGLEDMRKFLKELPNSLSTDEVKIATELLALTFVRTVELQSAQWSEFDLKAKIPHWIVPGNKMKKEKDHLVPLSARAVELLNKLHKITGNSVYLFPNQRTPNKHMSRSTILRVIEAWATRRRLPGMALGIQQRQSWKNSAMTLSTLKSS